jgi:hypothetical protein
MPSLLIEEAVPGGGGAAAAETVTAACADFALSAMLVAVTVKTPGAAPAVKSPLEEIVPPVADQVTPVFDVPVTLAENCCVVAVSTEAEGGLIPTDMVAVLGGVFGTVPGEPAEPTQPARPNAAERTPTKLEVLQERYLYRHDRTPAFWKRASGPQGSMDFIPTA